MKVLSKNQCFWSSKSQKLKISESKLLEVWFTIRLQRFILSKSDMNSKFGSPKFRFGILSRFCCVWDFEGLNAQIVSLECTQLKLYNPSRAMIGKLDPKNLIRSSMVMMSCYPCLKTSKFQPPKKVEKHSTHRFTGLFLASTILWNLASKKGKPFFNWIYRKFYSVK